MNKNNTLKVLLITILFTYLLTWIFPISYYNGGLYTDVRYPAGLFDIFNYPTLTLYYFGQIAVYVLTVGAFYGVLNKTGVFRKICDRIVNLFKGKEIIFFSTIVVLLSVIVAFCGLSYELIFLLPLLASIILLMGYDKMTIAITFIGSIAVKKISSLVYFHVKSAHPTDHYFVNFFSSVYVISIGSLHTPLMNSAIVALLALDHRHDVFLPINRAGPLTDALQDRHDRLSPLREGVLYPGRDLVIGSALNDAVECSGISHGHAVAVSPCAAYCFARTVA